MAAAQPSTTRRPSATTASGYSYARIHDHVVALKDDLVRRLILAITWVYQRTIVEIILRRKHIQVSKDGRRIPLKIQHDSALIDTRHGQSYISNNIRTSRYTVWDFIPKQLFFQFSRVGNFYFLCVGIPQMVHNPLNLICSYAHSH